MNYTNFFKSKKIVITGGLGFLGSNLAHRLSALGAKTTLVDCLLKVHGGNPFNFKGIRNSQWIKGDIRNSNLMAKVLKGQDVLFNIAAQTSHTDSMQNPFLDVDINTKGQINLLETCRRVNPGIRIVYCSTRAIYGSANKRVIDEETLPNPLDIYSADKYAGENYHKIYAKVFGLNATILRVANGYGPRAQMQQPSFGILNWFTRLAIDDQEIKIFGDGKQVRDYAYVSDIVEAFLMAAASQDVKGEIFNVGSGRGVPLIDIVKKIVKTAGKGKIMHVPWPETNKKIDVGDFIADVRKIRKKLGWQVKVKLEEGLQETIGFYEKNKSQFW